MSQILRHLRESIPDDIWRDIHKHGNIKATQQLFAIISQLRSVWGEPLFPTGDAAAMAAGIAAGWQISFSQPPPNDRERPGLKR